MGSEKKANYGATEASFFIELPINNSGMVFTLINKSKGQGKFHPVYKTETIPKQNGRFEYGVIVDTDTLCDAIDDKEILIHAYSYQENGNHKKIAQGSMTLMNLKMSQG
jgi:hypothetical protein